MLRARACPVVRHKESCDREAACGFAAFVFRACSQPLISRSKTFPRELHKPLAPPGPFYKVANGGTRTRSERSALVFVLFLARSRSRIMEQRLRNGRETSFPSIILIFVHVTCILSIWCSRDSSSDRNENAVLFRVDASIRSRVKNEHLHRVNFSEPDRRC